MGTMRIAAKHEQHETTEQKYRDQSAQAQNVKNCGPVSSLPGVVVITIEQYRVNHVTDLSLGSLNQSQLNITRSIFNAVIVLGHSALRGKQYDAAGVGILLDLRIPRVAETHGLGQRVNLVFFSGQKVPARIGFRAA